MRAIDLYAGIGGWSLGLRLAGIDVVASYEWWKPAIATHSGNHGAVLKPVDIRQLDLDSLPSDIDFVVGSPPCTEFSYANRGGSGDLAEGQKDLIRFFEVVDKLKPSFWAMENVPRVAEVLRDGFSDSAHALYRFRHLNANVEIVDFSDYGTPQARRRCIATNIPFDLIRAYQPLIPRRTLGDVLSALSHERLIIDPVWGVKLDPSQLTETEVEPPLNAEELRMNRDSKCFHPVYNNMAFPDVLEQPSRTITATCTRVSRESIIIPDPGNAGAFRRLTIRERACLQGFPITYQFYARSFSEKAKMIGNAIPPTLPYLLALAAQGKPANKFRTYADAASAMKLPKQAAPVTPPDREGKAYPATRAFRAALPGLRFKSGMRFELANRFYANGAVWQVRFLFGPPKDIREVDLDGSILRDLQENPILSSVLEDIRGVFSKAESVIALTSPDGLQSVWTHRSEGMGPYEVVDRLGELAEEVYSRLLDCLPNEGVHSATAYVLAVAQNSDGGQSLVNRKKLERYALPIISGFIVGDWFNTLDWHSERKAAA